MAAEFSISLDLPVNGAHTVRLAGDLDLAAADEVDRFLAHLQGTVCLDTTSLLDPRSVTVAGRSAAQGGI
jgi:hypothetical protein